MILMKPTLVIDWDNEKLFFYDSDGDEVAWKFITGEDIEGLEFYGVDFETLSEKAILDLHDVLQEAGGMWDDLSSFIELASKAS